MSQFKVLFDTINSGTDFPSEATFDASDESISKSLSVSGSGTGPETQNITINISNENIKPDEFFIISAEDVLNREERLKIEASKTVDMFDDPRKKISTSARDDLNFYIEIIDENEDNVDFPIFGSDFRLRALRLGVNPSVLTINSAKIVNRYQTLTRWVEEHWGDELDNISIQGSTLAFIIFPNNVLGDALLGPDGQFITTSGGLNTSIRNLTEPYKELQQIVRIYQMNGLVFQEEKDDNSQIIKVPVEGFNHLEIFKSHPRLGMVKRRLYVKLAYDYGIFIGYFESFDVIEDASTPYRMSYNANFKAEKVIWR